MHDARYTCHSRLLFVVVTASLDGYAVGAQVMEHRFEFALTRGSDPVPRHAGLGRGSTAKPCECELLRFLWGIRLDAHRIGTAVRSSWCAPHSLH